MLPTGPHPPPPPPLGPVLGRLGALEVRLATTADEVCRAQATRFEVFYREGRAVPDEAVRAAGRDADAYDERCDHLLVLDRAAGGEPTAVGTTRLLRGEVAARSGGFYSAAEYDLPPLLAERPNPSTLEVGRSCVRSAYRDRRTVELLWHGIWAYALHHRVEALFGCASLEGTDPARLAQPLSFLHHHAQAPEPWRARAVEGRRVPMDLLTREAVNAGEALRALPPLLRGYLRLGAGVGDGAVIDRAFGTTDVFVVLPVADISARYVAHFGADAGRHAA